MTQNTSVTVYRDADHDVQHKPSLFAPVVWTEECNRAMLLKSIIIVYNFICPSMIFKWSPRVDHFFWFTALQKIIQKKTYKDGVTLEVNTIRNSTKG